MFTDHALLETVPGQDFDFAEAFEDTFHGEGSSEARFKPLGKWFENKELVPKPPARTARPFPCCCV